MTVRSLISRTASWGLAACLIVGSAGEASVAYRVPLVPEAARTARGGGSAADRSRREDLLRWLRTDAAADQTDAEQDTRSATTPSTVIALPSGDDHVPSSAGRTPVRCRST
jgi:hypothetical protein